MKPIFIAPNNQSTPNMQGPVMETQLQQSLRNPFGMMTSSLRLIRWLGPWGKENESPAVETSWETIPHTDSQRPIKLWIYRPLHYKPRGCYLLLQGVHYEGPEDPRMDRFARILAHAGFLIFAPCIPDYLKLRIEPESFQDADRIMQYALQHPLQPFDSLGVFTISFGSLLGFYLSSHPTFKKHIHQTIFFGGYVDWKTTIRFCMTGEVDGKRLGSHDKLNLPVLFLHIVEAIDPNALPDDLTPVLDAWRQFIQSTWGRLEMKQNNNHIQVALRIAEEWFPEAEQAELPEDHSKRRAKRLFLIGCGAEPGAVKLIEDALAHANREHLDPHPYIHEGLQCPIHIIHGADDDVIPWTEAIAIEERVKAFTRVRTWLTGMYGHTGTDSTSLFQNIPAAIKELRTMLGMLRAIATTKAKSRAQKP